MREEGFAVIDEAMLVAEGAGSLGVAQTGDPLDVCCRDGTVAREMRARDEFIDAMVERIPGVRAVASSTRCRCSSRLPKKSNASASMTRSSGNVAGVVTKKVQRRGAGVAGRCANDACVDIDPVVGGCAGDSLAEGALAEGGGCGNCTARWSGDRASSESCDMELPAAE